MLRTALTLVAIAALVGAGVVAGVLTNRWGPSEDDQASIARLARVPKTIGPWVGEDYPDDETTHRVMRVANATGWLNREYRHEKTGDALAVMILYGPSGPLADHTPDVCNAAQGYKMAARRDRLAFPLPTGGAAILWAGRFEKDGPGPAYQVYWAWGTDGDWSASDDPHREFVMKRAIYKLYVTRTVPAGWQPAPDARDPAREFLTDFLPEVKQALAPG